MNDKKIVKALIITMLCITFFSAGKLFAEQPSSTDISQQYNTQITSSCNCIIIPTSNWGNTIIDYVRTHQNSTLNNLGNFDTFMWHVNIDRPPTIYCDTFTLPNTAIYYYPLNNTIQYFGATT